MIWDKRLSLNNKWSSPVTVTLHLDSGLKACHLILKHGSYEWKILAHLAKKCDLTTLKMLVWEG